MSIAERIIRLSEDREPDFIIGGKQDPNVLRWWLIPRNRVFNVYLHHFMRSDYDRALHDHPWLFNFSWLLAGDYIEHTIRAGGIEIKTYRKAGDWKFRFGAAPHRVELSDGPCWTLFITGPKWRTWGFHCPNRGFVPWYDFCLVGDEGSIGKGCDA